MSGEKAKLKRPTEDIFNLNKIDKRHYLLKSCSQASKRPLSEEGGQNRCRSKSPVGEHTSTEMSEHENGQRKRSRSKHKKKSKKRKKKSDKRRKSAKKSKHSSESPDSFDNSKDSTKSNDCQLKSNTNTQFQASKGPWHKKRNTLLLTISNPQIVFNHL